MDRTDLAARLDHTVLGPTTTAADVRRVVAEAAAWGTNACVPPCYVTEAVAVLADGRSPDVEGRGGDPATDVEGRDGDPATDVEGRDGDPATDVAVVTVVGFPHGQHAPAVKREEAVRAVEDGVDGVDVVANVGRLLAGENAAVREDIAAVVEAVPVPVKVIVEAPLLEEPDLRRACRLAADAGADMVKTATGFADGGATVADVSVMAEYLPVKASGGVGSWAAARRMLDAGAERIGTSSGVTVLEEFVAATEG